MGDAGKGTAKCMARFCEFELGDGYVAFQVVSRYHTTELKEQYEVHVSGSFPSASIQGHWQCRRVPAGEVHKRKPRGVFTKLISFDYSYEDSDHWNSFRNFLIYNE